MRRWSSSACRSGDLTVDRGFELVDLGDGGVGWASAEDDDTR